MKCGFSVVATTLAMLARGKESPPEPTFAAVIQQLDADGSGGLSEPEYASASLTSHETPTIPEELSAAYRAVGTTFPPGLLNTDDRQLLDLLDLSTL